MTRTKELDHSYQLTEKILANRKTRTAKTSRLKKTIRAVNVGEDNSLDINKLSVKERQELQNKGLCFRCRKPGHISRDCPSKPKGPVKSVNRKVQQVIQEGSDDSEGEETDKEDNKEDLQRRRHALLIPGYMQVGNKAVEIKGLINTGADAVIVNRKIVERYNLPIVRLPKTPTFRNADDSVNKMGTITHRVEGTFNINGKKLPTKWYVADIG
ncbi:hypothetical protein L227DRAFT_514347 [Lentinus tigrinus ALCF2SS1-6]|uniref:CCHC-type domain-containing protein n=1 Tax=Lentinus tigrinus ALCF2SS1-6 TaxID=1328759 RepID=A0A5C2RQN6_9APHY|nr:hypothetical protein L227DRAFT_514347 [Lentinus tigrinus ALCF2SS1-6]